MSVKVDLLITYFLFVSGGNFMATLGSICIIVYYLSKLKFEVIDKNYKSSWRNYIKSIFKKLRKSI